MHLLAHSQPQERRLPLMGSGELLLRGQRCVLRDWRAGDVPVYGEWLRPHHAWHDTNEPYSERPNEGLISDGVRRRERRAAGRVGGPRRRVLSGLEVLAGVGDGVDGPARLGALAAGDQRADVDDPLALLTGDAGPVVGVGGVGQVLVLAELIHNRVDQ